MRQAGKHSGKKSRVGALGGSSSGSGARMADALGPKFYLRDADLEATFTRFVNHKVGGVGQRRLLREERVIWFRALDEPEEVKMQSREKSPIHLVDHYFGFDIKYYDDGDEQVDSDETKPRPPHLHQGKPSEKNRKKGGTGERQVNLMVSVGKNGPRHLYCRLLTLALKKPDSIISTFAEATAEDAGGKKVFIVDHENKDHEDSRGHNLRFIRREDDPAASRQPKTKTKKAKTTTSKTTSKKAPKAPGHFLKR